MSQRFDSLPVKKIKKVLKKCQWVSLLHLAVIPLQQKAANNVQRSIQTMIN